MQYILALILLVSLFALTDPFMYWMPDMAAMVALVSAAALSAMWIGFVAREHGGDERDVQNRMYAGRIAYLSGIGILTLALVLQGVAHAIDPWIPLALGTMVLAKVVSGWYTDRFC
ncbi:hypothetical protein HY969_04585 [Candidatus Kaiserbacteria bacterium]|nr:hypothetical protein [Candidatus Kaiserbacteria bacterium]